MITSIAISVDGSRLVTGSEDHTVKVWEAETGRELLTLKGHTDKVTSVAFSSDGKQIASGSYDGTVKVWFSDFEAGQARPGKQAQLGARR